MGFLRRKRIKHRLEIQNVSLLPQWPLTSNIHQSRKKCSVSLTRTGSNNAPLAPRRSAALPLLVPGVAGGPVERVARLHGEEGLGHVGLAEGHRTELHHRLDERRVLGDRPLGVEHEAARAVAPLNVVILLHAHRDSVEGAALARREAVPFPRPLLGVFDELEEGAERSRALT